MVKRIVISILVITAVVACTSTNDTKEVVFVCTHGAARSPIAAAYFNKLAKENNLNYHAVFKGTEPDEALTKGTINGLTIDGFNTDDWQPEKVSSQDIEKASKIVTFDCSVPTATSVNRIIEWNGTPSISENYSAARDVIKGNVEKLIETLKEEK